MPTMLGCGSACTFRIEPGHLIALAVLAGPPPSLPRPVHLRASVNLPLSAQSIIAPRLSGWHFTYDRQAFAALFRERGPEQSGG